MVWNHHSAGTAPRWLAGRQPVMALGVFHQGADRYPDSLADSQSCPGKLGWRRFKASGLGRCDSCHGWIRWHCLWPYRGASLWVGIAFRRDRPYSRTDRLGAFPNGRGPVTATHGAPEPFPFAQLYRRQSHYPWRLFCALWDDLLSCDLPPKCPGLLGTGFWTCARSNLIAHAHPFATIWQAGWPVRSAVLHDDRSAGL